MEEYGFRDPKSKRIFQFLKDAYTKDDEVLRVPLEKCGWRSLVQIAQGTGVPAKALYGSSPGHFSTEVQKLLKDHVVEMRYFTGERGRGGEVMRFRIAALPRNQQQRENPEKDELFQSKTSQLQSESQIREKTPKIQELGRRLAAIMFTDIVGYTALAQTNEGQALKVLDRHNRFLRPLFQKHRGKDIKTIGDSFLVEFESGLDAAECAIGIQEFLHDYNQSSEDEWKIRIRIGIHVGDVTHREGDVLGDAVNIASRIQQLAEVGGICLTSQVHDLVKNKIQEPIESIGSVELKNVSQPIEIYRVLLRKDRNQSSLSSGRGV